MLVSFKLIDRIKITTTLSSFKDKCVKDPAQRDCHIGQWT